MAVVRATRALNAPLAYTAPELGDVQAPKPAPAEPAVARAPRVPWAQRWQASRLRPHLPSRKMLFTVASALALVGVFALAFFMGWRRMELDGTPVGEVPVCIEGPSTGVDAAVLAPSGSGSPTLIVLDEARVKWEVHRYDSESHWTNKVEESCVRLTSYDGATGARLSRRGVDAEQPSLITLLGAGPSVVWLSTSAESLEGLDPRTLELVIDGAGIASRNASLAGHVFVPGFWPVLAVPRPDGTLALKTDDGRAFWVSPRTYEAREVAADAPSYDGWDCAAAFVDVKERQLHTASGQLELVGEWPRLQVEASTTRQPTITLGGLWKKLVQAPSCALTTPDGVLLSHRQSLRDDSEALISLVGYDGALRWTTPLGANDVQYVPGLAWVSGARVILLYRPARNRDAFVALDARTGERVWTTKLDD